MRMQDIKLKCNEIKKAPLKNNDAFSNQIN
jgi:hypothetical protein